MVGKWTLPGGRVRGGETIAMAVEREVLEETGVRVVTGHLIEVVEIMTEGYHYVIHDHLCTPVQPNEVPQAADDASEARYVRPSELAQLGVSEAVVRIVRKAVAMRQVAYGDEWEGLPRFSRSLWPAVTAWRRRRPAFRRPPTRSRG